MTASALHRQHADLRATADLMWPEAQHERQVTTRRNPTSDDSFLVLPSRRRPRLLVPEDRRLAAAGISRSSVGSSTTARVARRALATGARLGLHGVLPVHRLGVSRRSDQSAYPALCEHLTQRTGVDLKVMAIRLGTPRPNQKPVVLMGDRRGRPVGYAKLGWNRLTAQLVAAEAANLVAVTESGRHLDAFRSPLLLDHSIWKGIEVVLVEALPAPSVTRVAPQSLQAAMRAIAGLGGVRMCTLGDEAGRTILERVDALPRSDTADRLADLTLTMLTRGGTAVVAMGSWHGDFRPWNIAGCSEQLLVWDWERHAAGRIVGLDAVHYHFPVPRQQESAAQFFFRAQHAVSRSAQHLAALEVPPEHIPALRAVHAAELVLRELEDVAILPAVGRPQHAGRLLDLMERSL